MNFKFYAMAGLMAALRDSGEISRIKSQTSGAEQVDQSHTWKVVCANFLKQFIDRDGRGIQLTIEVPEWKAGQENPSVVFLAFTDPNRQKHLFEINDTTDPQVTHLPTAAFDSTLAPDIVDWNFNVSDHTEAAFAAMNRLHQSERGKAFRLIQNVITKIQTQYDIDASTISPREAYRTLRRDTRHHGALDSKTLAASYVSIMNYLMSEEFLTSSMSNSLKISYIGDDDDESFGEFFEIKGTYATFRGSDNVIETEFNSFMYGQDKVSERVQHKLDVGMNLSETLNYSGQMKFDNSFSGISLASVTMGLPLDKNLQMHAKYSNGWHSSDRFNNLAYISQCSSYIPIIELRKFTPITENEFATHGKAVFERLQRFSPEASTHFLKDFAPKTQEIVVEKQAAKISTEMEDYLTQILDEDEDDLDITSDQLQGPTIAKNLTI